ncbi:MAG TPA: S8 family serine peptidase, partial [Flavisolibacter sp.]
MTVSFKNNQEQLATRIKLKEQFKPAHIYKGWLNKKQILQLLENPELLFISEYHSPMEELNTGAVDYTLNRINKAHHSFTDTRGRSIVIAVKERAFDTTDIDLKGRVLTSGVQSQAQTAHASIMATIVAGAGNSSPFALGVAPAALVSSIDFTNLFPEANDFYTQKKICVQNHSYGTVLENFYGNEAVAYDISAANQPTLLHVFSAGNSGTTTPSTGTYVGLTATANLTGNFKQSKNTISVSALDSIGRPMIAASRGPAYDGRVKPELSAYGEDGSSGAAALVSGTIALLQEAYMKKQGRLPTSDLVKAVLINSADDVGPTGIDYLTGY